ncbi:hypothetical protein CASFOL_029914 [Castilleja foliolosa]|uniref:Putative plant transposon protein domain-containing protein n=1 Tax=Castilleja foliolosa TaxID=1961234 RepID=A0ABD3CC33_9LAMI
MADKSSSRKIPLFPGLSVQEEHAMFLTSQATSDRTRAPHLPPPAPWTSRDVVVVDAVPISMILPGEPGNELDLDNLPTVMPTAELRGNMSQASTKRSRRLRGVVPGEIPTAIPRSQSGPRRSTPLERMNLVDVEENQSDADDEDYLPPESVKASSFIPDLTPDELESIAAESTQPVTKESSAVDDASAPIALIPLPVVDEVETQAHINEQTVGANEIQSPADLSPPATATIDETPAPVAEIPEVYAPSSPKIPHTDFFSEENIGTSIPAVSELITPANIHVADKLQSEDSAEEETLADMLESLKNLKKSPKTSVSLPVGSNAVNIVDNDSDYLPSSSSASEDTSTAAADRVLMETRTSPSSSDDLNRVIDEVAEEEEKDEDDIDVTDLVPHTEKFLTVGCEASFKDLQSRSMICEKRLMVDVFVKNNLVEFFRARGVYVTVTTAVPFVHEIVLEFYANLLPQVCKVNSASYGKVFIRGKFYTFTPEKINLLMSTENYQGTSAVDNMDDVISTLTHGKITKWKEQLSAPKLTSFYSVLHKIAVFNWIPSKNSTVLTRPQAQLLYRLGKGIKFNFGQMVFDLVTKFAQTTVVSSLLFPSLIFNLLKAQGCAVLEGDVLTGEAEFFTIRTHLMKGDRVVDLPWVDRRSNVIEGNVGTTLLKNRQIPMEFTDGKISIGKCR